MSGMDTNRRLSADDTLGARESGSSWRDVRTMFIRSKLQRNCRDLRIEQYLYVGYKFYIKRTILFNAFTLFGCIIKRYLFRIIRRLRLRL